MSSQGSVIVADTSPQASCRDFKPSTIASSVRSSARIRPTSLVENAFGASPGNSSDVPTTHNATVTIRAAPTRAWQNQPCPFIRRRELRQSTGFANPGQNPIEMSADGTAMTVPVMSAAFCQADQPSTDVLGRRISQPFFSAAVSGVVIPGEPRIQNLPCGSVGIRCSCGASIGY